MKAEIINQSLRTILPEDLLQVLLKLQELRESINSYMASLGDTTKCEIEGQKWERADEVVTNINLAIVDLADLLSMELEEKILDK